MTMREFIKQNKTELVECIHRVRDFVPRTASCSCPLSRTDHTHEHELVTEQEMREWIANDEGLYQWAKSEGVRV